MRACPPSLASIIRAFKSSDWEESASVRWAAQLMVGAVPGLLIVLTIMHLAKAAPQRHHGGTSVASIVPLLSASTLADTAAFHRLSHEQGPAVTSDTQFRLPGYDSAQSPRKRVLTVTKKTSSLPVNFKAPRQSWNHLDSAARHDIDAGMNKPANWQRVVLHGSGSQRGNAGLLERYHSEIRGLSDGVGYHFIIGNGQGATDGSVKVSQRWLKGLPSGGLAEQALRETSISVCFVGDFQTQQPTRAQLAALDELLDYISIKLGPVPVTTHSVIDGETSRCLGAKFPTEQILQAANPAAE